MTEKAALEEQLSSQGSSEQELSERIQSLQQDKAALSKALDDVRAESSQVTMAALATNVSQRHCNDSPLMA